MASCSNNMHKSRRSLASSSQAPIAMIGYILQDVQIPIDVTSVLTSAASQVLTLTDNRTTDRGLTRFPSSSVGYVYVTNDPLQSR